MPRDWVRSADTFESKFAAVPGWFLPQDQQLFRWFLDEQARRGITGDLAELGVYLGKSAIVIGGYLRSNEIFTVIDLFEAPAPDDDNQTENVDTYSGLTQKLFEDNYLRFHEQLPVVVKGLSSEVLQHAAAGTHRFVHVDASHLYDNVRKDIASARSLLHENGVVVFDDIRWEHTPGVAAAVWAAVDTGGLRPIVISEGKLYGTWGDTEVWQKSLLAWLPSSGSAYEVQQVAGAPLIRVWQPRVAKGGVARATVRSLLPRSVRSHIHRFRLGHA
jgi:hypothetical protein